MNYEASLKKAKEYFNSGATLSYDFRKSQLQKLKSAVLANENELHDALYKDLRKTPEECWVTETGFLISEINAALRNLSSWMRPERVRTNLLNFPSRSSIMNEPLGVVLIIGPWNYPLQLLFTPLVGAIAAGNCVVLKPSEFAVATASVMEKIIRDTFSPEYIQIFNGEGSDVVPSLMQFRFDHVFYTGSTAVGKIIYKMAAEKLVPVTLELGGKSPCIVESDADLKIAARRIALTKFSNAGQMCVAPDYVLIQESVKDAFLQHLKKAITSFYGEQSEENYNYGRIINKKQFARLTNYLKEGKLLLGGRHDESSLFFEPTVIELDANNLSGTMLMRDEIFGPVLPVISFNDRSSALKIINLNPDPLAFYVFTSGRSNEEFWLNNVRFGGGCINNASWHLTNHQLPFGGRGDSGMGRYHGKYSFETFSHKKSILKTPTWFDPSVKYPPFKGKLKLFKWVIK